MAGVDYSGFTINFKTEVWTDMGYVRDGKKLISFHKTCDDEIKILTEPGGTTFCQFPGIAKHNDWWIVLWLHRCMSKRITFGLLG